MALEGGTLGSHEIKQSVPGSSDRYGCFYKNRGGRATPKSSHFHRGLEPLFINHPFWGTIICGNTYRNLLKLCMLKNST